jgi:hypothetical protein
MSTSEQTPTRLPVIRSAPGQANVRESWRRLAPAWVISAAAHAILLSLLVASSLLTISQAQTATVEPQQVIEVNDEESPVIDSPTVGIHPDVPPGLDLPPVEGEVVVPGQLNPDQAPGIPGAPDLPAADVPPPPGLGPNGLGGARLSEGPGHAPPNDMPGGMGGPEIPVGFRGRGADTRERRALEGGGSQQSEAAVAAGLLFLAQHQAADGHWSLDRWDRDYHKDPVPSAAPTPYRGTGLGQKNDVAGTAFGLLPFLGAGYTHKPPPPGTKPRHADYRKTVLAGLRYLLGQQTREGEFPGGMYAHGLATIAVCEAYGMTADPALKRAAQRALDFIVSAQDPAGGGWRYAPRQGSDTSVTGWEVMALKSGQMAGLNVPSATLRGAEKWLDSCMTSDKGGYGYTGPQETPTMTAVGLLCRMYFGWGPKNPGLLAGVKKLKAYPPGSIHSLYYEYYATQVMYHMGGEDFGAWNPRMRDLLLATQDKGDDPKRPQQKGSWDPRSDVHEAVGGRVMITSLSLLTLEVYYRYLPLYRRDMGVVK